MNFQTKIAVDFASSLAIAGAALLAGWTMAHGAFHRRWFRVFVLAPLLTPTLLVSYAWAHVALTLSAHPWMLYGFHAVILALRLAPIAALARHFFPPPLSAEAEYCHRLIGARPARERAWFRVRAAGGLPWLVFGLLFLLAFPEFELASLWSLKTWPVSLFDAQAGGLALPESLRLASLPTLLQLAVLAGLILMARRLPQSPAMAAAPAKPSGAAFICAVIAFGILTSWPLAFVTWQAIAGLPSLTHNSVFPQDLAASLGFAVVAGLLGWLLSGAFRKNAGLAWGAVVPGLLGPLIVAMLALAFFQLPGLHELYDTPLPLLAALVVILLPCALLLRRLIDAPRASEALHLARLARSRRLVWELDTERRFAAVALLACWAWFEFTASSILAPVGLTPVFVRLHNLAHYGQTAALSAMLFAAVATPAAVLSLTLGAARLYARRDAR